MIFHILKISVSVIIISTMLFLLLYICIFSNVRDLTIVQSEENFECLSKQNSACHRFIWIIYDRSTRSVYRKS